MKTKLKPCPFCGEKPTMIDNVHFDDNWGIECLNEDCPVNCTTFSPEKVLAIKAWNTRKGAD